MITKKRMAASTRVIITTITVLLCTVAVLAYLNAGNLAAKKELEEKAEFLLTHQEKQYRITLEDIHALGPVDFVALMDTSTTDPTPLSLGGVELWTLLQQYQIKLQEGSLVQFRALDGYASAVTGQEVLTEDNVYLCIYMNGERLKPKQEGGLGPYLIVIKNDRFSQRWCKFVEEIQVR
jgi:hypothetical protein